MNHLSRFTNRRRTNTSNNESVEDPAGYATPPDHIDLNSSAYAQKRKRLMELLRDLKALGADQMIDIPSIAVIGGQSAGKSSLIEAVSGITVPRDSGTCTRCPMECYMSSFARSWTCKIELRIQYDRNGGEIPRRPEIVSFGPTLTDKSQFELALRRAQAAILSPHLPPTSFLNKTADELKIPAHGDDQTLKFSKNTVCVNIEDPEATDLVFADLPGLIQNEDPSAIDIVRELAVAYINRPQTLILVTIPITDDIQNQQAVLLARQADPDGGRTIGVLTKPDLVGRGSLGARERWKQVLRGESYPLKHGYYCVRLPDDEERARNLSRAASQQISADFFQETPPWSELADQRRLGITGFVTDISRLLIGMIEQAIPKLREETERLLVKCEGDLAALPPPITNTAEVEILDRITRFCSDLTRAVDGYSEDKYFVQENRKRYDIFKAEICKTYPSFVAGRISAPMAASRGDDISSYSDSHASEPEEIELDEVRQVIANSVTWELPHVVPFEAMKTLIKRSVDRWRVPSTSCFVDVFSALGNYVDKLARKHFERFKQLEKHVLEVTQGELASAKSASNIAIDHTIQREERIFFAPDVGDYDAARTHWLIHYKKQRRSGWRPTESYVDHRSQQNALNALAAIGYPDLTVSDLTQFQPKDRHENELALMADVRAYFEVSHKRIIHAIPMAIEQSLIHPVSISLQAALIQSIFKEENAENNMQELLGEEPGVARRREELNEQKQRLEEIRAKLRHFALES